LICINDKARFPADGCRHAWWRETINCHPPDGLFESEIARIGM